MTKILIIEDEVLLLEEMVEILTFEGFDTYGAENGAIGIEMVHQHQPDLILCDIMMPHMDGYQVLLNLQSDPKTRLIPFMFITAKSTIDDIRVGMNLGADDYLTKPFTQDELLQAINVRLEKRRVVADLIDRSTEQLEHLQSTIMLTLPHELRTPLSSIAGYSEILAEDFQNMTADQVRTMITGVRRGAQRLHRLVENYLLYAQLQLKQHQQHELEMLLNYYRDNPVPVAEVLEGAAITQARHYKREQDLQLNLEHFNIPLPADEISKIFRELADNAFKFSEAETPVAISAHHNESTIAFQFEDQGRGMSTDQIEQIGAYMQFDRKLYEQQGMGLGLTIARMITELFGGTFSIESEPESGTRITVSFPISAAD